MERVPHILVVEDDPAIVKMTATFLSRNGYRVSTAPDGRGAERVLADGAVDLIVLDLMLAGGEDGLVLARRVRMHSDVPIIMLTAKAEEVDRIVGLETGADDYLTKPFSTRELLARIRAVMRRQTRRHESAPKVRSGAVVFSGWRLDRATRELHDATAARVAITGAEYDLLLALCERPRRVLTRDQLLDLTQGRAATSFDRSIDTLVCRIRQKIETDPRDPQIIRTVRSGGYFFAAEVAEQ